MHTACTEEKLHKISAHAANVLCIITECYTVRIISRGSWPCAPHVIFYLCDILKNKGYTCTEDALKLCNQDAVFYIPPAQPE